MSNKLVLTNRAALVAKYGRSGLRDIEKAVDRLSVADRRRGLNTRLVYLDSAALGRKKVIDPADPAQNKAAVDAVATAQRPEYLMILGSHDVVPYQQLKNKLHDPADPDSDEDRFAPGDLPYACEGPFGRDTARFLGPTRVLGRIPDITGATTPEYVIELLDASARARSRARPVSAFALSAKVWERSTRKSIQNIFGTGPAVLTSPKMGPAFGRSVLGDKVHVVNCHGDKEDPTFSGEYPKENYFTAMDARQLSGVGRGTVAAFECCYAAQLYDPNGLPAMSISNTYLAKGAAGVLASTTIAYGLTSGNSNADVLCQLFVEQVLNGASLGRALLEARLEYVRRQSVADPYDEKTLAQFLLLGDPSIHPFPSTGRGKGAGSPKAKAAVRAERLQRRIRLMREGAQLSRECAYTVLPSKSARRAVHTRQAVSSETRRRFKHLRMFTVHDPASKQQPERKALSAMPKASRVYVATKRRPNSTRQRKSAVYDGFLGYEVDGDTVEIDLVSR